ncbi:MAG TPA: methyltransferase domain-containing protein [Chloroflexia bacterium]|nr:methyltransferase domain-containing protein [Chloroflexia bacterium]
MRDVKTVRARLLKLAFESLYGPFAWAYDWVSRTFFMGQWRVWQRAALPHLRGTRVLELGMGTGNLQIDMARAGLQPVGIDLSPQMLRQARRKWKRLGIAPFRMCRARATALPFPDAAFDSVVSTFPSEYIADERTLAEVSRVLRPGGRLVVVPGGWLNPKGAKGRALEGVSRAVYGYQAAPHDVLDPAELERRIAQGEGWYTWLSALRERMSAAGYDTNAHLAGNNKGTCLVIVADKRGAAT